MEIIHTRICFKKSGDHHPYGDLAKSGYKPHMQHGILFIFLYLWLLAGVEYSNLAIFPTLFSHVWKIENSGIKRLLHFSNFQISFCLHFGENSPVEKKKEKKLDRTHTGQISSMFPNDRAPGWYSTYLWHKMAENGIKLIHPFYYLLPGKLLVAWNAHLKTKRKLTEPKSWTTKKKT